MADDDYTPTTEQVRGHFAASPMAASPREEAEFQFDRWLAAHDAAMGADRVTVAPDRETREKVASILDSHFEDADAELVDSIVTDLFASGVLGAPADQRFDGPPPTYRGHRQPGHGPQFYGPDDVVVDGDWLADLESRAAVQPTADRDTVGLALFGDFYPHTIDDEEVAMLDRVLAVLVPADRVRAETLEAKRDEWATIPGDHLYLASQVVDDLADGAAEYRKAAGA